MDPNELKLFRSLEYLNLALNNIIKIEGLGGMEWLRKLDLTLNFIDVDALEESIDELTQCRSLEELFLIGNPCMGIDGSSIAGSVGGGVGSTPEESKSETEEASTTPTQKQIGWKGCRAYIVARLPTLQFLDGKEIKRSERILSMQQLPALTVQLHSFAWKRRQEREQQTLQQKENNDNNRGGINAADGGYISDEAPTHHNPETRTKMSNELYDQKQAKEKQATANQAPTPKGEKEFEEEHKDTVQKVREREELGRELESNNSNESKADKIDAKDKGGVIKQCNQGKYQFWFEEESSKKGTTTAKTSDTLIMRVAIPKYISISLIDVDIHPTYVSIVIKSKILRVILPVEVRSDQSVARRSASSGYLELIMPKVNPNEIIIGLAHVRDHNKKGGVVDKKEEVEVKTKVDNKGVQKKRERLGQSMMEEAGKSNPLKIVQTQVLGDNTSLLNTVCDGSSDDEDGPPPLH